MTQRCTLRAHGALLASFPGLSYTVEAVGVLDGHRDAVRALIARMAPTKAILISTHTLTEVPAMCPRAIIVDRGRVVHLHHVAGLHETRADEQGLGTPHGKGLVDFGLFGCVRGEEGWYQIEGGLVPDTPTPTVNSSTMLP